MARAKKPRILAIAGRNIQAARKRRGITQEVAASRSGISYKRYQVIEAGKANITLLTLHRIARAIGIKPFKLLK